MPVELFAHQVAQKRDIHAHYGHPVLREVPREGLAGTLVSATGTGKTLTTAVSLLELLPGGRFLVMVPTLDLLVQTAEAWRRAGRHGRMVAVCDLPGDPVLEELRVSATTNPIQLAVWAGTGPVVVLATYASLVERHHPTRPATKIPGPIEHAMAGGPLMYGQRLAPFDMAVVDFTDCHLCV